MKIKTIMCNSSPEFYQTHAPRRASLSTDDMQLVVVNIPHGPESLESSYDEALAAPYVLQQVASAAEEGFDAVIIDCASDPALRAAREISDIPVVSAGESSYYVAMLVAAKFSVVTSVSTAINELKEHVRVYGVEDRVASVRAANVPVLELHNKEVAAEYLYREAKKAIEEDGAQAIVLGCTGMMALRDSLEERLGVPVIEPHTAAVQCAAMMVNMKLHHSRLSYIKAGHKKCN